MIVIRKVEVESQAFSNGVSMCEGVVIDFLKDVRKGGLAAVVCEW